MDLNKLIEEIFELKQNKEKLTKQLDKLKEEGTEIDKLIDNKQSELLKEMKEINTKEITSDNGNIIATLFKRENDGYKSDAEVLKYLKEHYSGKFIKSKITESLDKVNLKKAVKDDENLAKGLEGFIEKTISEYVVVTDKENHKLMLEHIEKGK